MVYLLTITDDVNTDLDVLALGTISSVQTFKVRVWNNKDAVLAGITDFAVGSFVIEYEPLRHHTIVVRNDAFQGRCTYSAKQDAVYAEAYKDFPLSHTDYDTIPSNKYNEYEIQLDLSGLSAAQKARIKLLLETIYFRAVPT